MASGISIISSEYCVPRSIILRIDMEMGATYKDNKVVFKFKKPSVSLHHRRVIYDVSENPIFTLYKKKMTVHGRWQVFKGNSKEKSDLLFSVKRQKMIRRENNIGLDVFLAENINGNVCDFKVKVSSSKTSCEIYAGESSDILARMEKRGAFQHVTVHPNIDYAFIVALLLMVNEMKRFKVKGLSLITNLATEVATGIVAGAVVDELMEDENDEEDEEEDADEEDEEVAE